MGFAEWLEKIPRYVAETRRSRWLVVQAVRSWSTLLYGKDDPISLFCEAMDGGKLALHIDNETHKDVMVTAKLMILKHFFTKMFQQSVGWINFTNSSTKIIYKKQYAIIILSLTKIIILTN